MQLSFQDRLNLQAIVVATFNAATGTKYLSELVNIFEAVKGDYRSLARLIGETSGFKLTYGAQQTDQQFADTLLTTFGLQGNQAANSLVLARLGAGQAKAELILDAVIALSIATEGPFAVAWNVLVNKTKVADYYSQVKQGSDLDFATLQKVLLGVNETQTSVDAAVRAMNPPPPPPPPDPEPAPAPAPTPPPPPAPLALALTTAAGESITGGAGNDVITGILSATVGASTFNDNDTVTGAAGFDTFNLTLSGNLASAGTLPIGTTVAGVEVVNLIHTDDSSSAVSFLVNSSSYADIQQLWQTDNAAGGGTFVNTTVGAGVTAGFRSTGVAGTAVAATVTVSGAVANQALSVALDGVASGSSITFAAGNSGVESVTGAVAGSGSLTINAGTAATTLNVGVTSSGNLIIAGAGLTTVDFSTSTGNLTANLSGLGANLTSLKGGAGRDTLSIQVQQNKALAVDLGAGNDTVVVTGVVGAAGTAAQTVITLGTGRDMLLVGAVSNVATANSTAFQNSMIVLTDFKTSEDVLNFNGAGKALNSFQLDNIKGAGSLFAAVQAAAAVANGSDVVFSYGLDAYVLIDGANAGTFGVGDGLIRLIGVDATLFTNIQNGNLVL